MLWYATNIKERIKLMQKITTFFLIVLLWAVDARAFSVSHDLFVTVGAFDASRTRFTYTLTPASYQISSKVSTNGFFDTVYPFKAEYLTAGKIDAAGMITTDYSYTSKSRFNTRGKQVFYNAAGEPQYQISTKNGKSKKRNFEPSQTPADTFDLQTVLAKLTSQYNRLGFCDSRMAVYDGKRRFDVIFKDEGKENLPASEYSFFAGEAAKCSLQIDKLLSEDDDTLWEFSANKPIYFWIARTPEGGHPFIARVQIKSTPLGELNAYTTKITVKE